MAALKYEKHELFCHKYLALDRVGAHAAYAAGFSKKNSRQQACNLLKRPEVQDRISELTIEAGAEEEANVELTTEQHMLKLASLRDKGKRLGQLGPAVRNEELRGRVAGYYVEMHELRAVDKLSDRELSAKIAAMLGFTTEFVLNKINHKGMFD